MIRYVAIGEVFLLLGLAFFVYYFNKEDLKANRPSMRWMAVALLAALFGAALGVYVNSTTTIDPTPGVYTFAIFLLPWLIVAAYATHLALVEYDSVMSPQRVVLKPTKAIRGATVAVATAAAGSLFIALDDGAISAQEWVGIVLAVLGSPALVGAAVYNTRNDPKLPDDTERDADLAAGDVG